MISLDLVEQSILELEKSDTSFAVCEKLACLYIVRENLKGYSADQPKPLEISGSSEFLQLANGKNTAAVFSVVGEIVEAVKVLHPKMYDAFLNKIRDIS